MSTKIATPFGLGLMLAIGIFATMLALGLFSGTDGFRATKLSAHVSSDHSITSIDLASTTAGATTQYTILVTGAEKVLNVGDTITITFNTSTTVPGSIAASDISLKAVRVEGTNSGDGGQLVTPSAVSVVGKAVTITVPDMDPSTASTSLGDQAISAGTGITIVFKKSNRWCPLRKGTT